MLTESPSTSGKAASTVLGQWLKQRYSDQTLSYPEWTRQCLYHPQYGYYARADKQRIGKTTTTDFYTAESLGPVFARLVSAAAVQLVNQSAQGAPDQYSFVEIGAESPGGLLQATPHPFKDFRAFGLKDAVALPAHSIVFMNELLDAQPFARFRYAKGQWREVGVQVEPNAFVEVLLDKPQNLWRLQQPLPSITTDGYTLDISFEAEQLLRDILARPWKGYLIVIDYGKTWEELAYHTPHGTGRGYYKHQVQSDLCARPGEQDVTAHVCWDSLQAIVQQQGFSSIRLISQERFFAHNALSALEAILSQPESCRHQAVPVLKDLLLPTGFGARFQVLTAFRSEFMAGAAAPAPRQRVRDPLESHYGGV